MEINLKSHKNIIFSKMQGCGNDFVVINAVTQKIFKSERAKIFKKLADRHFGIGCDQILLVEKPKKPHHDFYYGIYNCDGSIAGQCGNGVRCFALFVKKHQLSDKENLTLGVLGGEIFVAKITDNDSKNKKVEYLVNMGCPVFSPKKIPFNAKGFEINSVGTTQINIGKKTYKISALSMGNPHAVLVVKNVKKYPVVEVGEAIEKNSNFPERVNVGFMEIVNSQKINLRVFERGSGETLACGSGACAAVVSGIRQGLLTQDKPIKVNVLGGQLKISWAGEDKSPVFMSGPAVEVFQGNISI